MSMTPTPVQSRESSGGWAIFVATYLLIAGVLNVVWGIAALSDKSYFYIGGLLWSSLNTWGWVAIIVGGLQLLGAALAAARQGADAARAYHASLSAGPAAALTFARQAGDGYLLDPQASNAGSSATTIAITVRGRVPSFVPGVVVRISETVQAPVEEFRS